MSIPEANQVAYDIYTLACRELLLRRSHVIARASAKVASPTVLGHLDDALFSMHKFPGTNRQELAQEVATTLATNASQYKRAGNPGMATLVTNMSKAITRGARNWRANSDITRYHRAGRSAAKRLFQTSGDIDLKTRWPLNLTCSVSLAYSDTTAASPIDFQRKNHRIVVRFSTSSGFHQYLSYPFWFLHEYTHAFSVPLESTKFKDGWMVWAAYMFVKQHALEKEPHSGWHWEHIHFLDNHLFNLLSPYHQDDWELARMFSETYPEAFWKIIYDLTSLEKWPGWDENWPDQLLLSIGLCFTQDRKRSGEKVLPTLLTKYVQGLLDLKQLKEEFQTLVQRPGRRRPDQNMAFPMDPVQW